jgi:hypothetical protein
MSDRFLVGGLTGAAPVTLTFAVGVSGELSNAMVKGTFNPFSGELWSARSQFEFRASLSAGSAGASAILGDCIRGSGSGTSVCNGTVNPDVGSRSISEVVMLSLLASNGDNIDVFLSLFTSVGAISHYGGSAAAGADFGHSVRWLGLNSATVGGAAYAGPLTLTSESGFDYLHGEGSLAPIPAPETYATLLAGLGLLGFAARRRELKESARA